MVANPNYVPAAFRRAGAQFFTGMEDEEVLKVAANALRMVQQLPARSEARARTWRMFDRAMGELSSRAVVHALQKIHEIHEREAGPGPVG